MTAICSGKNAEYVKELGADEVIDYTKENIVSALKSKRTAAMQDFDLLVDCVGGTELISLYASYHLLTLPRGVFLILYQPQILKLRGAYVTIVGDKDDVKALGGPITYLTNPGQILRYIKGWIWGPRYACVSLYSKSTLLEETARLSERGLVRAEVQQVIDGAFDEREAWREAVESNGRGASKGQSNPDYSINLRSRNLATVSASARLFASKILRWRKNDS